MTASKEVPENILAALKSVIGESPASLHEPIFMGNEKAYLMDCIDSGFVSSVGGFVDRFESDLATYAGSKYAVAVVNGTAALHIALILAGVQAGDEVLVPTLTFVATANAVAYCGAFPHFVDSEIETLGIDTERLRDYLAQISEVRDGVLVNKISNRVIRALLPMHTFGHPSDIEGLLSISVDFHLPLIEDAAESLGSTYYSQHLGTFGETGTLSFNGNKTITTGGGGAILTNDRRLAEKAKHLTTTAKVAHPWDYYHDAVAYNYRMPNLNAALGCAQLEQMESFVRSKRALHLVYKEAFHGVEGVELMKEPEGARSNFWLQALLLQPEFALIRDSILSLTNSAGVSTRPAWIPLHQLSHYMSCPRMDLSVAVDLSERLINIPSSVGLAEKVRARQ